MRVLVRPLLTVTRADVLDYLAARGQSYREDASNADVLLTRNRIRHELLPLLRTYNSAIADVLGRLAHQADEVFALQEQQASTWLWECELPRAGGVVVLDSNVVHMMHDVMLREVVRLVWRREGWPTNGMTFDHWDRVVRVARGNVSTTDLPGGVHVRNAGRVVQLGRRS